MARRIIKIDELECDGCGVCVNACREGAIGIINGKAKLICDDYCDGLGGCLPVCPKGAISFETRDTQGFYKNGEFFEKTREQTADCGCPRAISRPINSNGQDESTPVIQTEAVSDVYKSELRQWPVQIKLVPVSASFYNNANILVSADCCAYACGAFHQKFMKDRITIIGCPKLDNADYTEKLTKIFAENDIKSVMVTKMEVPCCSGIEYAASIALKQSGKIIPLRVFTLPVY